MATVRFELVDEAKKLRRDEIEVVAATPFTVEVMTPAFAARVLELTAVVVATLPLTVEVMTLAEELSRLVVVVAIASIVV